MCDSVPRVWVSNLKSQRGGGGGGGGGAKHPQRNPGVTKQAYLSKKALGSLRGVILGVPGNHTATNLLHRHVLDVESHVVSGKSLGKRLVMHLHRLHLRGDVGRRDGDHHSRLQDTGLNTAHWNRANTFR